MDLWIAVFNEILLFISTDFPPEIKKSMKTNREQSQWLERREKERKNGFEFIK